LPWYIIGKMVRSRAQIKKDIFDFISSNGIMTLATQSKAGPWVCTVYYGHDKEMNLYIVTGPATTHGKNLEKTKKVAFNIFDSRQGITKPKKGVQGRGVCEIVKGLTGNTRGLYLWHKANPGIEEKITVKDILKKLSHTKVYKISPTYLKFFNKTLYSPEEYGVWEK